MENNSHRGSKEFGVFPGSRAWKPLKLGKAMLSHRIGMAPLTRNRAPNQVISEMAQEYYEQRASQGGLLVTEATFISKEAGGYPSAPGIWSDEQVEAWKRVVDRVHAKGGIIYLQLWAIGRANKGDMPDVKVVSSSTNKSPDGIVPEQMTIEDIKRYLDSYEKAAENAIKAGFDGVEIHNAHGYLLDQFLQESCNNTRSDEYSGSLENRARFTFEVLRRVVDAVGEQRTAIRFSPFSNYYGMGSEDPFETWGYVLRRLKNTHPKLSYVSITDPRMDTELGGQNQHYSSDYFRAIIRGVDASSISKFSKDANTVFPEPDEQNPTVVFCAGGYAASDAEVACNRTGDIIGYGRFFIANPDLPFRLRRGLELNPYNRKTFYIPSKEGYTDYTFATEDTKRFVPATTSNHSPEPSKLDEINSKIESLIDSFKAFEKQAKEKQAREEAYAFTKQEQMKVDPPFTKKGCF